MNIKSIEEHGISFYTFIFEKESKELKKNDVKEKCNFDFVKLFCIETISLYDLCHKLHDKTIFPHSFKEFFLKLNFFKQQP